MRSKTIPIPILIFVWLVVIGGVIWWWQGREETKEVELPEALEESGQASLIETKPLKEDIASEENTITGEIVISFFNYLNQGKYSQAEELLAPDYLEFVKSAGGLEKLMARVPMSERAAKVVIINEKITGDTAEVEFEGFKPSGEKMEGEGVMGLVKIEGEWKLSKPH